MRTSRFSLFRVIFLLAALSGCSPWAAPQSKAGAGGASQGPFMNREIRFIDVHNHLFGRYGSRSLSPELDYDGAARVALEAMQRLGIRKIFIMPPPFPPDHPGIYDIEDLLETVRKHPDRFAFLGGGGTLNPMIQQAVEEGDVGPELRRRFEKKALEIISRGALGFGEMTAEHLSLNPDHPYESAPPDHPLFLLLADIAARKGVPIDLHMEAVADKMPVPERIRRRSSRNPEMLQPNIEALERLLDHNRGAKIIWAHAGWDNTGHRTTSLCARLLKRHPNLYMSIKISRVSIPENRPITRRRTLRPEWLGLISTYPGRFLIGSDQFYISPMINIWMPRNVKASRLLLSLLPPELARKVGYENAERIFRNLP